MNASLSSCMAAGPRAARLAVRASASTTTAAPRTLKALDLTKRKLIDSHGGRTVRNIGDGEILEIAYVAATDSVTVVNKTTGVAYATEVGKDNRISIVLESAAPAAGSAGGAPSFPQLQALLKASGPGPEAINGRLAMLAFVGVAATELATGRGLAEQATSGAGVGAAAALGLAVMAASLAPLLLGKVAPQSAFPSENESFADRQLPYFWTGLAETINGRVAMLGLAGLLANELVRGAPLF